MQEIQDAEGRYFVLFTSNEDAPYIAKTFERAGLNPQRTQDEKTAFIGAAPEQVIEDLRAILNASGRDFDLR